MKRLLRMPALLVGVIAFTTTAEAQTTAPALITEFQINGLQVILKQRPGTETVTAGLFLRGGAATMSGRKAGIERFLLDVASEASAKFPADTLRAELASAGSILGSSSSHDYSVLTMGCTRSAFDRTWDIFTDVAIHPSLLARDVERKKRAQISEHEERLATPDGSLESTEADHIFAGHPYGNAIDGTTASLKDISAADLAAYHRQVMQTSRLLLVVVGNLDENTLRSKVTASFGSLPKGDYKSSATPLLKFTTATATMTTRPLDAVLVQGVFAGPAFNAPDYDALALAMHILNASIYLARVKRGLYFQSETFLRMEGASSGGVNLRAEKGNEAAELVLNEISALKANPPSDDDLERTKSEYILSFYMDNQTSAAQVGSLARYELIGGGWRNAGTLLDRVNKVTAADIQRVAKLYLRNLQFTVVGDQGAIRKQLLLTEP